MNKIFFLIVLFFVFSNKTFTQQRVGSSPVNWYTIEEAEELHKKNPKPLFIDFHTEWCGWCKRMMATTFTNPDVAGYLNRNYYPVRFDAETMDTIVFRDTTYVNKGIGRKPTHDWAIKTLQGKLTYPTVVFTDKEMNMQTAIPGYVEAPEMLSILVFMAEEGFKFGIQYPDFQKYFEKTFPNDKRGEMNVAQSVVKWYSMEEAMEMQKESPRKFLIDIYLNWKLTSTMMMMTTYNHPVIGKYINENFYPVRIDAITRDTIEFRGHKFSNPGKHPHVHQFVFELLRGKMEFPATVYLDENANPINVVQAYLTPEAIEPILKYLAEDYYKDTSWKDFAKDFKSELAQDIKKDSTQTQ